MWMDRYVDGQVDQRTNRLTDRQISGQIELKFIEALACKGEQKRAMKYTVMNLKWFFQKSCCNQLKIGQL
jgi:hypothetical protein